MPYGNNNALLGSNIDPRLFLQDFSGFVDASKTTSNAVSGLGDSISATVKDYAKEQKDSKNKLKASQVQIDAAIKLFPDQAPYLSSIANELKNEDAPLSDRAAMASQVADLIQMGVGQKRYETELGFKQRDQAMQEQESSMRQQATALQIEEAQRGFQDSSAANDAERKIKTTVGPALLEQVLGMASPSIAESVRKNAGNYTDEEKYSLASSVMGLIPKSERAKAPQIQDVPLGNGGSIKMQWDETSSAWVPIQTAAAVTQGGYRDLPSDQNAGPGLLPPADPSDPAPPSSLPPPIGYTPPPSQTISPKDAQAMEIQKKEFDASQSEKATAQKAAVSKSQEMLSALKKLETHPGFSNLFGTNFGVPTWIPGSEGADANALFKQVEGMGFIEAIQAMKGMGALSNSEGEKASISYLGITPSMSEMAAKIRIFELENLVARGIQRANTGNLVNPDGTPKVATPAEQTSMSDTERLRQKLQPR